MPETGAIAVDSGWRTDPHSPNWPGEARGNGTRLLIAGLMHVAKKGNNAKESLATWTDLVVGVVVMVFAVYTLDRALAG